MSKSRSGKKTTRPVKQKESQGRWPWIALGLLGVILIIATGLSSTVPQNGQIGLRLAAVVARAVSALTGRLSTVLCFLLILTSLVKASKPEQPFPRHLVGLWLLYLCVSAVYHDITAPWESTFLYAKTGGGGGLVGGWIGWFFRTAVGRCPALILLSCGILVSASLACNRSPYAPFAYIWLGLVTVWKSLCKFVAHIFREHGPNPEDLELGDKIAYEETHQDPELAPPTDLTTKVQELKDRLTRQKEVAATARQEPPTEDDQGFDFSLSPEQPPLGEGVFYEMPPLSILGKREVGGKSRSGRTLADLEIQAKTIEKTLLSFGIAAKVSNYTRGPTVTRFELQPGPGVKVASIVNLAQDLALAMAARNVRIEAPIPGKSAIGIEVPNKEVALVHLRDVLETREFRNSPSPVTIALGEDIGGRPVITNLDSCLHLLIAGATGAGKSVCINSVIASILYKARPDQVKLLLIDPKRVELSTWAKIPHLIAPVVFDPKKAAGALRWAIKEMETRYEKFSKVGTRNIERYNQVASPQNSPVPAMPYIVIIIDELSDLMTVSPAEVEDSIFRLAQMARAAGIYLVVATQRPSVDVLTGTIKANIPSRIAFAVASGTDSRTILDTGGAEKLLGRGDMLFSPVGSAKPLRAQGCFISEREIDELVSFVSEQGKPKYADGILSSYEASEAKAEIATDPLFTQALRIVVEAKQASVSLLQRKLPIGYSRAARLIDAMETQGYVGPYEGSKPREVRMTFGEYMRLFEGQEGDESAGKAQHSETPDSAPTRHTT